MKRGFVDTADGQIHYRVTGEGPAVIVFHQTPESSRAMVPVLEGLASRGLRAIGMDTMGYGESDRPNPPFTSMEQFAASVSNFITGLGLERAHLVGCLTGSQIAMQTAADYPDQVETLVTQEAFNWGTESRRAVHERIHRYHTRREDGGHLIELWQRTRYGATLVERDARLREFLYVNDDTGAEVYGSMGWEGAGPYAMCRQDIWSVAPRIKAPTLLTYRENSELDRALEKFLQLIPNARGQRNCPFFMRDPDGFAEVAANFIQNPVTPSPAA